MPKHHEIDYASLQSRFAAALREAWQNVRKLRPSETVYMFGLETDDDITVLTVFANTEEQYAADRDPEAIPAAKWVVDMESPLSRAASKPVRELEREVNRYVHENHSDETEASFSKRKKSQLKAFEAALTTLDEEGVFGSGTEREQLLLMITFCDADDEAQVYTNKVIKRINPIGSSAPYLKAFKQALIDYEQQDNSRQSESAITRAKAFLQEKKQRFDRANQPDASMKIGFPCLQSTMRRNKRRANFGKLFSLPTENPPAEGMPRASSSCWSIQIPVCAQ